MEVKPQPHNDNRSAFHFERPRLNQLFSEAVKYPLVVVCAGGGYGKTSAVNDFTQEYQATTAWIQLSERDNTNARFWEKLIYIVAQINQPLVKEMIKMGFPDTREKLTHYQTLLRNMVEVKKRIIIMDDFHCIEEPSMIRLLEECFFLKMPPETSIFLISRTAPNIKITDPVYEKQIFNITEDDLRFTESELAQYFRSRDVSVFYENLREIIQDTGGWAFAIDFIARAYQKAPGYSGYVRNAMRTNIFHMIETGLWDEVSENLQNFLLRLSLIDHLSIDLLSQLAGEDADLLAEFERLNAYVRRDNYINAYLIHPLFLEFLTTKQEALSEKQKLETYAIAGDWCAQNGFKIDAMSYYEKTGNYQPIVSILEEFSGQIPQNIAQYAAAILDRAPAETFDKVEFLVEIHLRTYIYQGLLQKSLELARYYEARFLKLPEDDIVRRHTLAWLYYSLSYIRSLIAITDNVFDSYTYVEEASKCIPSSAPSNLSPYCPGPWINCAGSPKKGLPQDFLVSVDRIHENVSHNFTKDFMAGGPEITRGELEFYLGSANSAAPLIALALKLAQANKHHSLVHRALFYTLRIAAAQGNFELAEQVIRDTKAQMDEVEYSNRFIDYDISLSWYYCYLGFPEKTVDWLKENFASYAHPAFIENFGNQIKARYCYATRNFTPLLLYIEEMKTRESFLFGRIEMLALEACVHYLTKNKKKAFVSLEEAYKAASPNEIIMPFIEMGKDMRTLTSAMLKESGKVIPAVWLEDINHKSATHAKHRSHIIAKYMQANGITCSVAMSPRETEILTDISHGLSRSEIAVNRKLSANTIKMVINNIRYKLGAENMADLIRIAVEKKLV